jgi:hypothetical protein
MYMKEWERMAGRKKTDEGGREVGRRDCRMLMNLLCDEEGAETDDLILERVFLDKVCWGNEMLRAMLVADVKKRITGKVPRNAYLTCSSHRR